MPELRHDPILRQWVIIAEERGRRTHDFGNGHEPTPTPTFCPFCEGNETRLPNIIREVKSKREPNRWQVRAVPNKFPALKIEGGLERKGRGIYDRMNGIGAHEVIIESPDHHQKMCDMHLDDLTQVFEVYRERLADLSKDTRFRYVQLIKNHGEAAGASLSHPHSQVIATPVLPAVIDTELQSARHHFRFKERCIFCDILEQEQHDAERIVAQNGDFLAYCPYASRSPFEVTILPRTHSHDFAQSEGWLLRSLAEIVKDVLGRLDRVLNDPPFNLFLHTAPNLKSVRSLRVAGWETLEYDFHWHVEIIPRLTKIAGFEWGTGLYINPTKPETAAEFLRSG